MSIDVSSHMADIKSTPKVRNINNDFSHALVQNERMAEQPIHFLREWRVFRKLTQQQLADSIGTSKSAISDLERFNLQLSPKWLRRIAPILNTRPGFILDKDPNELDTDILDIWNNIHDSDKKQAAKVLQSFIKAS